MDIKKIYSVFLKTDAGIEVLFPDFPECKAFASDEDAPFGNGVGTLHASMAGRRALDTFLESSPEDFLTIQLMSRGQVEKKYPNALAVKKYEILPDSSPPENEITNGKPLRGTIDCWQLHHLTIPGGEDNERLFKKMFPHVLLDPGPMMFTGTVVEDPTGRFRPGWHMRSSYIVKIDREQGFIETENSVYHIQKEGNDVLPDLGNGILKIFY